jgi:DNA-directed RNA polymerase subunit RPC12/RpoP
VAKDPLSLTHPEIAAQAAGWDPSTVTSGSGKKFLWRCDQGHEWPATVGSRVNGSGCPVCLGRVLLPGYNDLKTLRPELAAEAHGWDPSTVSPGQDIVREWQCPRGHVYPAKVAQRSHGSGCPVCDGKLLVVGVNDLATTHPAVAAQAVGWDPRTVMAGSPKVMTFRGSCGHEFSTKVFVRTRSKSPGLECPRCAVRRSNQSRSAGRVSLAEASPEIAAEADGWDPSTVSAGSHQVMAWRCAQGHTWSSQVVRRSGANSSCPYCSGKLAWPGYNDLATTHPDIAAEADGWDPRTVMAGSQKKMAWRCAKGHPWQATVGSRTRRAASGCPVCANRVVMVGVNDLATTHPDIAAEAYGFDPRTVVAGGRAVLEWQCPEGHVYPASLGHRTKHGTQCPVCSGRTVVVGVNDLATTHPDIAAEADGWDPRTVVAGANKRVNWRCAEGHTWTTDVANRTMGNETGCPSCAEYGYNPGKPGWLYFLRHPEWQLLQIGISNDPDRRLREHARGGWELIELEGPMDGAVARRWEQEILRALARRGVALAPDHVAGQFSGYTEAWVASDHLAISLEELKELVDESGWRPR